MSCALRLPPADARHRETRARCHDAWEPILQRKTTRSNTVGNSTRRRLSRSWVSARLAGPRTAGRELRSVARRTLASHFTGVARLTHRAILGAMAGPRVPKLTFTGKCSFCVERRESSVPTERLREGRIATIVYSEMQIQRRAQRLHAPANHPCLPCGPRRHKAERTRPHERDDGAVSRERPTEDTMTVCVARRHCM